MDRKIRLYIEEEQEILREAFKAVLPVVDPDIEPVRVSAAGVIAEGRTQEMANIFDVLTPNVVLLGLRSLEDSAIASLGLIRKHYPATGFVVLCAYYNEDNVKQLKQFLKTSSQKGAYLFKHSVDSVAEFSRVIHAVAEGRLIIDPSLFQGLMVENNLQSSVLKSLTQRELEILSWMAKGYRNASIAEVLSLEPKTVENHINNIFSKLSEYIPNARHARVAAVISYLKATGSMTMDMGMVDWDTDASEEDTSLVSGLDSVGLEPMDSMSRARVLRLS
jgi:DNA-binding NarL/FixJ family response regulator